MFGKFARNYERFYLARSSSLSKERKFINRAYKKDQPMDDEQTEKMKERIYSEAFSGSAILKREIDRAMLYLNLPSAILLPPHQQLQISQVYKTKFQLPKAKLGHGFPALVWVQRLQLKHHWDKHRHRRRRRSQLQLLHLRRHAPFRL